MSRKITRESVNAFLYFRNFSKSNTKVLIYWTEKEPHSQLMLHWNTIARNENGKIRITSAGWSSNTTKERLNGLPWVSIAQRKWI